MYKLMYYCKYCKFLQNKKTCSSVWVKSQKLCHKPHYLSFLLGHGRGSLWPSSLKALKYFKVCLSDRIPFNPKRCTYLDTPSALMAHYKIVHYCIQYMYFPKIVCKFWALPVTERYEIWQHHFSSWLQGRELTQKIHEIHKIPAFPPPERNEIWTTSIHLWPRTSDLTKLKQKDINFTTS